MIKVLFTICIQYLKSNSWYPLEARRGPLKIKRPKTYKVQSHCAGIFQLFEDTSKAATFGKTTCITLLKLSLHFNLFTQS